MFSCYQTGGACPLVCIVSAIVWVLVASVLLCVTWNKVIVRVSNLKTAKFWQALLVVVTLLAFCAPRYMMHKKGHGGWHKGCPHSLSGDKSPSPAQ